MSSPDPPSALRMLQLETDDLGLRYLAISGIGYSDGSEEGLLPVVLGAEDLSSTSDTLISQARSWPETYHLSPARGNVVRPFRISESMRVLEVGAGCGAVTRPLGETGAMVDALEPVQARARVARARTRDLPNVEVYAGEVANVPSVPTYDLVVAIGVLEYVGGGTAERRPYREWLSQLRRLIRPGGALLLAIENKLGVKYLAGAPEDHSNRVYDSVEGYPWPSPARTFSRRELADLMLEAGFESSEAYGAFPDYKLARAVLAPGVSLDTQQAVFPHLPVFPSPDWILPRPPLADEARMWRTFIDAGLADETFNSLVVVALAGGDEPVELWDRGLVATYFADHRRLARFGYSARVRRTNGGLKVERSSWNSDDVVDGWLLYRPRGQEWVLGESVVDVSGSLDDAELGVLLGQWVSILRSQHDEAIPVDLVPHNLVVDGSGNVHPIDTEWFSTRHSLESVAARGCFHLAERASLTASGSTRWSGMSVLDLARSLAEAAGLPADIFERSHWVEDEAELQAVTSGQDQHQVARDLKGMMSRVIDPADLRLRGQACTVVPTAYVEGVSELHARALDLDRELDAARREFQTVSRALAAREEDLASVRASRSFRLARSIARLHAATRSPLMPTRRRRNSRER